MKPTAPIALISTVLRPRQRTCVAQEPAPTTTAWSSEAWTPRAQVGHDGHHVEPAAELVARAEAKGDAMPGPPLTLHAPTHVERGAEVLTPDALAFLAELQRRFGPRRDELVVARERQREEVLRTGRLDVLSETREVRDGQWRVAEAPADLRDRRVEITGMVDRCAEVCTTALGGVPNQLAVLREDVAVTADELLAASATPGGRTLDGLRANVSVGVAYLQAWRGNGAVGIHHLMEDAATAETSRSQSWQWVNAGATLASGETVTRELVERVVEGEHAALVVTAGEDEQAREAWDAARRLFVECALDPDLPAFLTYQEILAREGTDGRRDG